MLRRYSRVLVIGVAAALLYAGPVAACLCTDAPPAPMPCCPDEPLDSGFAHPTPVELGNTMVCDLVPADLLPTGSPDLPTPVAVANAEPSQWAARAPPVERLPSHHDPDVAQPIYLVTLRLRY